MADQKAGIIEPIAPLEALWQDGDASQDPPLQIDIEGFEGPLDLLLHLARTQKVDLTRISVQSLAEQYLDFIEQARVLRLELAADYLVMAAWLAFLKSKLLIPKQADDKGETGEELAAMLQFRLKRLEAMREAAVRLVNRNQLGREFFKRGAPEMVIVDKTSLFEASLYELLSAYTTQRQRMSVNQVEISSRAVWSLKDARDILTGMIGEIDDWMALDQFLIRYLIAPDKRVSALASSFAASLELVREGKLEIKQASAFEPVYMRQSERRNLVTLIRREED
ncbi:segregation and condensation protein A [Paenochrobactrum pullorum]|uniref:segregation and condensation protein A n=1 Tax=Paenochrobactrum pullorum TaxID=1324351 RepID=UPI0035BC3AFE